MKKKNNNKKSMSRPFDAEIKQMKKEKVILIAGIKIQPFAEACAKRGIELGVGSAYNGGVVLYEK